MSPTKLSRSETPFEPAVARHDRWLPFWLGTGFIAAIVGLRWAALRELPLPPCLLRKFTGVPCPSCGCTRSLLAWSHFDLAQAFFFNPLFFLCCVTALMWFGLSCADGLFARGWRERWRTRTARWPIGRVFLVLLGLNWLYLCLWLPK
jgi:hypothetical protein